MLIATLALLSLALLALLVRESDGCQVPLPLRRPFEDVGTSSAQRTLRNVSLVYHFHIPKAGGTTLSKSLCVASAC